MDFDIIINKLQESHKTNNKPVIILLDEYIRDFGIKSFFKNLDENQFSFIANNYFYDDNRNKINFLNLKNVKNNDYEILEEFLINDRFNYLEKYYEDYIAEIIKSDILNRISEKNKTFAIEYINDIMIEQLNNDYFEKLVKETIKEEEDLIMLLKKIINVGYAIYNIENNDIKKKFFNIIKENKNINILTVLNNLCTTKFNRSQNINLIFLINGLLNIFIDINENNDSYKIFINNFINIIESNRLEVHIENFKSLYIKFNILLSLIKKNYYLDEETFIRYMGLKNNIKEYGSPEIDANFFNIVYDYIIKVFTIYSEKNIIHIDKDFLKLLIKKNNIYNNFIKYFLNKNQHLIDIDLLDFTIKNHDFDDLILFYLDNKLVLNEKSIKLIIEKGLCLNKLFDIIFTQYLDHTRINFELWAKNHKYDIDHYYNKFIIDFDQSYFDIVHNLNTSKNYRSYYCGKLFLTNKLKIPIKTLKFYKSFTKVRKLEDIEKIIKKFSTKKKIYKLDKYCIDFISKGKCNYDNFNEIINYYLENNEDDLNYKNIVLFSNRIEIRNKYIDKLK